MLETLVSKECNCCGELNYTLTLSDREWKCANCGAIHDRDENAAKNIKQYSLTKSGWGTPIGPVEQPEISGALKQEVKN